MAANALFRTVLSIFLLLALSGCGEASPAQPVPVHATGRWLSDRPLWSGADTSRLTLEINSVNEPGDNGRAYWNFLVERVLLAEYDEPGRRVVFMLGSTGPLVTGSISEDGRTMRARFAGTPTFGGNSLDGLVGDTLTFRR